MSGGPETPLYDRLRLSAEVKARTTAEACRERSNAVPLSQEEHQDLMKDLARALPAFARCGGVAR